MIASTQTRPFLVSTRGRATTQLLGPDIAACVRPIGGGAVRPGEVDAYDEARKGRKTTVDRRLALIAA